MNWLELAACRDMGSEIFYPSDGYRGLHITAEALLVCKECLVREDCLQDALDDPHFGQIGIRGGMTERQRRQIIRRGYRRSKVAV